MDLDTVILPALIAMTVGCAIWGGLGLVGRPTREKKRLAERLGNEAGGDADLADPFKPLLRVTAVAGVPAWLAARVENTDFTFFVTALLIQRQTGGDLSEVLGNISGMIRGRLRLQQQVRSKTAEGRFTGYVLVAFPAVMFALCYTQNLTYCSKLLTGDGLYLLGTAIGLQVAGLLTIKKITTIRV